MVDDGSLARDTADGGGWLLAIECATRGASVALLRHGNVVAQQSSSGQQNHAETLLAMVDAGLSQAGVPITGIAGFAVSIGPGAFTSLRIGLATVKGLAFGGDAKVAAVSTLAALAWEAAGSEGGDLAVALDARRGEVYGGVFRCRPADSSGDEPPGMETMETLCPDGLFTPEEFAKVMPGRCLAAGSGAELYADALGAVPGGAIDLRVGVAPSARAVGKLGYVVLAKGGGVSAAELSPHYLRRAEAEALRLGSPVEAEPAS